MKAMCKRGTALVIGFGLLLCQAHTLAQTKTTVVPRSISFVEDVVPTLSRLGCNSGTCHGAAQGKGGFRLSLRGYAPESDFLSITRQMNGRRISREEPEHSLFLRKPLLGVPHRGGKRLDTKMPEYSLLLNWIRQGTTGITGKEATLIRLELTPSSRAMRPKETQALRVKATYSDGRTEDVTHRALFSSNDLAIVTITEKGVVTQQRAGEASVIAKYRDKLAIATFVLPYPQKTSPALYRPTNNYIDTLVNAKLKQLNLEPSPLCTDEEFLRRAYLDAIGTLPTVEEATLFLDDKATDRRAKLIDDLLQRPEFGTVWGLKFGDLFVLRREYMGRKNAMLLQQWVADQFNANRGWDQIATDILTATGSLDTNKAGLFYISRTPQKSGERYWIRGTEATAEMIGQVFLGNRLQCAKCHNHPTERFTQDDYYHFTALWQQVTGKDGDRETPERLEATANGDVTQPRTGQKMAPRPLDRSALTFLEKEDRRIRAAQWLVGQEDFARNIVNRLWARCFGMGIVEPVDDIRSTNPARNEPLMQALCADLRRHKFDLKYLMGTIMRSRTYQLSSMARPTNRIDTRLFARYPARRLNAEELADAVTQVIGVSDRYSQMPQGTRAIELADSEIPSIMLDTFGRPPRVQPSDTERVCNPAIAQALYFLNSSALQEKLKAGESTLKRLVVEKKTDAEIVEYLYLSALSRRPRPKETQSLIEQIKTAKEREEGLQDALWAILNSKEFLFNH
jgi:hypothetical protein